MAIPLNNILPSLGSSLGTGLAQPLNQGLDLLAQHKMMQLQQRHAFAGQQAERQRYAGGLEPLLGKETATFLSNLAPEERKVAFQNLGALLQLQNQGAQQGATPQAGGLSSLAAGNPGTQQPGQTPLAEIFTPPISRETQARLAQAEQHHAAQQELSREKLNLARDIAEKKHGIAREQQEAKAGKEARSFLEPYIERAEASRANIRDYDVIKNLAKSGKIRTGIKQQLLDRFGISDIGRNVETQIADKLMARLAQNATSAFGAGRITNYLESTFQRSLPSLRNTKEGIIALSELNEITDKINLVKEDAASKIIKENGGLIPLDINSQIKNRTEKEIDNLSNRALATAERATSKSAQVLKVGESASKLPDVKSYPVGTEFTNKQTGKKMRNDGYKWVEVK